MTKNTTLARALELHTQWKEGRLGGAFMPEDAKPDGLGRTGEGTLAYFTLPMALNYQRNSYKLWEAATKAWHDAETTWVFDPVRAANAPLPQLQQALLKHKVALQPNKHPQTWQKICVTLCERFDGRIETMLGACGHDISRIKQLVQGTAKAGFPYLAGAKICNYWIYVLTQYTDYPLTNRAAITIAPDTHVVQASRQLGLVSEIEFARADVQQLVTDRWAQLLKGSGLEPIDMHTPLWLWSRGGFA